MSKPLTVNIWRGDLVESRHHVHGLIMSDDGTVLESWGDIDQLVYSRSSLKTLQALPLVESGAADAFELDNAEIALACASHNAEPVHIKKVTSWLNKIGLTPDDLECGGHLSINKDRAQEMIRNDETMTGLYSDCSGKHTGILTTALHMGIATRNYTHADHPVQQQIFQVISEMTDYDLFKGHYGIDGCSVPNPAIPLKNLALGFARLANPARLTAKRATACQRILNAIADQPYMVAGMGRLDTVLIEASNGNVLCKAGAAHSLHSLT